MSPNETLDKLVGDALEPEPTAEEREAVWQAIVERLDDEHVQAAHRLRSRLRLPLPRPAIIGLATLAATCGVAAVALLPAGEDGGPSTSLLATASAAEVLTATAENTGATLPPLGPADYLYARMVSSYPGQAPGVESVVESWASLSGDGRIVESRAGGPRAGVTDELRFDPGSDVGYRRDGTTVEPDAEETWRAVVRGAEVAELPTEPDGLLSTLRERVGELFATDEQSELGPFEVYGRDLLVMATATRLMIEAPLSPEQRGAILEMLAGADGWYEAGTSVTPPRIENLGRDRDALDRAGITVRITLSLTAAEALEASGARNEFEAFGPRGARDTQFAADLVLDPDRGRLLEVREYESGVDAEPDVRTVTDQRVVGSVRR